MSEVIIDLENFNYSGEELLRELYKEAIVGQQNTFLETSDFLALELPDSYKKRLADEQKQKNEEKKTTASPKK